MLQPYHKYHHTKLNYTYSYCVFDVDVVENFLMITTRNTMTIKIASMMTLCLVLLVLVLA